MKEVHTGNQSNGTTGWVESRRLLITEDDPALRQILYWEFEAMGYQVITASCCLEALSAVTGIEFDLALLDYNLPDGTGTQLLYALRQVLPDLTAVICSGRTSAGKAEEAEQYGASCFVAKPVSATSLNALFEQLLPQSKVTPG